MLGEGKLVDRKFVPLISKLFGEMKNKADEIIKQSKSAKGTVDRLMKMFRDQIDEKGKEMLAELLTDLSEIFISKVKFTEEEQQDRFIEANIGQEILDESDFACPLMEYHGRSPAWGAIKVALAFFVAGAGVALCAGAVAPATLGSIAPKAAGIAAAFAVAAGLFDYLKIEPKNERTELEIAVIQYLRELQPRFTEWMSSREEAFDERSEAYIPVEEEEHVEGDFPA